MKNWLSLFLCALLLCGACALAQEETRISLGETILVNDEAIPADPAAPVHLALEAQTHEDVPEALRTLENRVIVIADAGVYRVSGEAADAQIAIRAGEDDRVRLILDGVTLSCRTAPAIACASAYDARVAGEYGVTLELAEGSENFVTGSHTVVPDGDEVSIEYDGAIGSAVSLGIEGTGSLTIDADNEGVEVTCGHLTIQSGTIRIAACDDPLNVSEDGVGVLTINGGYVYSAVKPLENGEGDGVDSNGSIVINGGAVINLAHPSSGDSGIDADLGSFINGGVVVGAGNMYDPIDETSGQLFMMLEFGEKTDQLVVVTDENDVPVFAYDFPHSYTYIAFSSPALVEGTYRVYLGGEITGEQTDGLYTSITAYTPGTRMQHGGAQTAQGMGPGMGGDRGGMGGPGMGGGQEAYQQALESLDLNELLKDADLNALLKSLDLNALLSVYDVTDLLTPEQIKAHFGDLNPSAMQAPGMGGDRGGRGFGGGFGGGPRRLESSGETASSIFMLSKSSTGFTNVVSEPVD